MYLLNRYYISLILIFFVVSFTNCKKTQEDRDNEKLIVGKWISTNTSTGVIDTIVYNFNSDNNGNSIYNNSTDAFKWEIKHSMLNTYYKKSPSYLIGNDQYNSKGMYKINSINDSVIVVVHHLYGNIQVNRTFYRN